MIWLAKLLFSKAGTILAGTSAIVLGFLLLSAQLKIHGLKGDIAEMAKEHQLTVLNLGTCRLNVAEATATLAAQNTAVDALRAQSAQSLAKAEKALRAAQKSGRAADVRIAALSKPLVAADQCSRAAEVDRRLLESLR